MLKVILYGLNECHSEAATWPVPMTTVDDDTQPQPHLFNPLPKKDLWLSLGVLFNAMEENVLMVLLSVQGHCQVLAILKNVLEDKDPGMSMLIMTDEDAKALNVATKALNCNSAMEFLIPWGRFFANSCNEISGTIAQIWYHGTFPFSILEYIS